VRNVYNNFVVIPEGKRPVGKPRRKWEDNIRMNLRVEGADWIHLAQDRDKWQALVNTVMNFGVHERREIY
jgi:hypothetical protein